MTPGGFFAIEVAISPHRSRSRSGPTTSSARPHASAVLASIMSPVRLKRRARPGPIRLGRVMVRPPPGIAPTLACVSANRAASEATKMSQLNASSRPPVMAGPLTAAMMGVSWGGSIPTWRDCWDIRRAREASSSLLRSDRSKPAQNASPAPVRMITATSAS